MKMFIYNSYRPLNHHVENESKTVDISHTKLVTSEFFIDRKRYK